MRSQLRMGWPSSNTSPPLCGQMPSSTRASVDLPEPEAPSTTVTVPAGMMALTPFKMGSLRPGAEATTSFNTTSPLGVTPMGALMRGGWASSN